VEGVRSGPLPAWSRLARAAALPRFLSSGLEYHGSSAGVGLPWVWAPQVACVVYSERCGRCAFEGGWGCEHRGGAGGRALPRLWNLSTVGAPVPFPVSAAFPLLGPPSSPPLALFDLLLPHLDVLRLRELPALARAAPKSSAISAESARPALEAPQGGAGAG